MKIHCRIALKLISLAILDQLVTTVLVGRGNKFQLYFSYGYFVQNYADSLLELWIFSLFRFAMYVGVSIALLHNMRDAIHRLPVLSKVYSVVLCVFLTYSLVKLLVFSELTNFTEPWRLGFVLATVIWDFIMCMVAYVMFRHLSQLKERFRLFSKRCKQARDGEDSNDTASVNRNLEDQTRLIGEPDVNQDEWEVLFSSWSRDASVEIDDSSSESDSEDESEPNEPRSREQPESSPDGASANASQPAERRNIVRLLQQMRADLPLVALATCFLLLASVGESVAPLFTARVVNAIVIEGSYDVFTSAIWSLLGVSVASTFCAAGRAWLMGMCLYRVELRLRASLFASLVRQELAFFDRTPVGDILSRLTTDTSTVGSLITINCNIFLRTIIKSLGLCGFMFYFSWRLSLLTVFSLSIYTLLAKIYGDYYEVLSKRAQAALAKANAVADEVLSTVRTVRSFANEMGEARLYAWKLDKTYAIQRVENNMYAGLMIISQLFQQILLTAILFYGGHLVFSDLLKGADLVSFMLYQIQLGDCLSSISDAYSGLVQALGASAKVFELIDRKPALSARYDNGVMPEQFEGRIELRNVSFRYPTRNENELVLKNVSFTVAPGEIVALVGKSGSGKSSIVSLIEHFYEPQSGQVLIDGHDVREYNHQYIHTKMALVSQEPVLYGRSIRDNIAYALDIRNDGSQNASERGRDKKREADVLNVSRQSEFRYGFSLRDGLSANETSGFENALMKTTTTREQVVHSAELSNAAPFIGEMRRGYDTQVGEKGCTVSGGQKQRIAIARALIREPKILLLDEATSALDTESESLVQQAIYRNLANRSVLIIAHRLSTIERADRIIVLDKGVVVESGSHQQLLALDGVYARLVHRQLLKEQGDNGISRPSVVKDPECRATGASASGTHRSTTTSAPIHVRPASSRHEARGEFGSAPKTSSLP